MNNSRSETGDIEIHDIDGFVCSVQSFQTAYKKIDEWKQIEKDDR